VLAVKQGHMTVPMTPVVQLDTLPPDASVQVDGQPSQPARSDTPWTFLVSSNLPAHRIEIRAPGYMDARMNFAVPCPAPLHVVLHKCVKVTLTVSPAQAVPSVRVDGSIENTSFYRQAGAAVHIQVAAPGYRDVSLYQSLRSSNLNVVIPVQLEPESALPAASANPPAAAPTGSPPP
jgi:hypothetical protein